MKMICDYFGVLLVGDGVELQLGRFIGKED
jgi:hypothetical protein